MPLISFAAGQRLTATRLNAALDTTRLVVTTVDQTVISQATPQNTALTLPVDANSAYTFEALVMYTSNTTPDARIMLSLPAGATSRMTIFRVPTAAAASAGDIDFVAIDSGTFGTGGVGTGTMLGINPKGIITTAGTAGSLTIQFSQDLSNATTTTLKIGSWLTLTKYI